MRETQKLCNSKGDLKEDQRPSTCASTGRISNGQREREKERRRERRTEGVRQNFLLSLLIFIYFNVCGKKCREYALILTKSSDKYLYRFYSDTCRCVFLNHKQTKYTVQHNSRMSYSTVFQFSRTVIRHFLLQQFKKT